MAKKKKPQRGGESTASSAANSMLSTRENSIDSVIARPVGTGVTEKDQVLCNGNASQIPSAIATSGIACNTQNNRIDSVSSFGQKSTLNNYTSIPETAAAEITNKESKRIAYDPTINERINPFDKDKIAAHRAAAAGSLLSSSSITVSTTTITSGNTGGYDNYAGSSVLSSASNKPSVISTSSTYTTSNITTSDKRDDNVKDRYSTQQGIRDQSQTGRFEMQSTTATNSASTTSSYPSEVKKQEFGRTKRSSSDAELIFGDKGPDFYKSRFSTAGIGHDIKKSNDSLADADIIFGTSAVSGPPSAISTASEGTVGGSCNRFSSLGSRDSSSFNSSISDSEYIYGKKEERNVFSKSLSVSSEQAGMGATERFRNAPKAYDPPKSASLVPSSGSGKWSSKYGDDDDYDLK